MFQICEAFQIIVQISWYLDATKLLVVQYEALNIAIAMITIIQMIKKKEDKDIHVHLY